MYNYYTEKSEDIMKSSLSQGIGSIADRINYKLPVAEMSYFEEVHKSYLKVPKDNPNKEQARNKMNSIVELLSTSLNIRMESFEIFIMTLETLELGNDKLKHFRVYGENKEILELLSETNKYLNKIYNISNKKIVMKKTDISLNKLHEETSKLLSEIKLLKDNL